MSVSWVVLAIGPRSFADTSAVDLVGDECSSNIFDRISDRFEGIIAAGTLIRDTLSATGDRPCGMVRIVV